MTPKVLILEIKEIQILFYRTWNLHRVASKRNFNPFI